MSIDKKQLVKLISYMSTFDGGLYVPKRGGNATFIMNMKKENMDYILWVSKTLNEVTGTSIKDRLDYSTDGFIRAPQSRLTSKSHPFLTKIRDRIYIDNHKVIDPHMLKLMDAEALAIIFMCDGGTKLDTRFKTPHASITLNTKGFSYSDNMALSKSIYNATGITTTINKHNKYWYLNVSRKSILLFVDTVLPYMCKSFNYKLERIAPAVEKYRQLDGDIVCSELKDSDCDGNDHN